MQLYTAVVHDTVWCLDNTIFHLTSVHVQWASILYARILLSRLKFILNVVLTYMFIFTYHSLTREGPWVEHLTSLSKRGMGALLNV